MIAPSAFSKVLMLNFLLHSEKSRKGSNVTKDMQQYLFASKTHNQHNSGISVLYQIYLPSKMKAELDFSLVWDKALVRYK